VEPLPPVRRRTERMELRPLEEADQAAYVRMLRTSAESWAPWTPEVDPTLSPEARFQRELTRARVGARNGTHVRLVGAVAGGDIIGLFALNEIVRGVFQSAYASWQVAARRMGSGYGAEGVRTLLAIAFDDSGAGLSLHRVQANIMPGNVRSLRIAEKLGFRREGFASRYLKIAGQWEDHVMYAVTREEWPPDR
jgi:ribosomal-protein-alanine N-acetyltransferase